MYDFAVMLHVESIPRLVGRYHGSGISSQGQHIRILKSGKPYPAQISQYSRSINRYTLAIVQNSYVIPYHFLVTSDENYEKSGEWRRSEDAE